MWYEAKENSNLGKQIELSNCCVYYNGSDTTDNKVDVSQFRQIQVKHTGLSGTATSANVSINGVLTKLTTAFQTLDVSTVDQIKFAVGASGAGGYFTYTLILIP